MKTAGGTPLTDRGGGAGGERGEGPLDPRVARSLRMLNIGYGNLLVASRVIAIVSPQSAPMRRLRE